MSRPEYPSDHRRWFRVYEDILDDPKTAELDHDSLALYLKLLATLNRQKSKDGRGQLSRPAACALARRERWAYAEPAYSRLVAGGLVTLSHRAGGFEYLVPNWSKLQRFAPTKLRRDSDETPAPKTKTKTKTNKEEESRASRERPKRRSPLVNLLTGEPPRGFECAEEWLEDQGPILAAEAQAATGKTSGRAYDGRFKSLMIRYWRHAQKGNGGDREPRELVHQFGNRKVGRPYGQAEPEEQREEPPYELLVED